MQNNNVYDYINITNVINQLNIKKTSIRGNYIYAICPFCQMANEKNGYLKINTISNVYICRKCESSGSSIELYANLRYISTKEAFKRLLKETPVLDNMPYTYNNPVKDEYYRDMVYRKFLELQDLTELHYKKLKDMNFTDDYIKDNQFKSIENNNYKKKEICMKLQEQGLKLDGIPGFFQDTDFKWNYKSHTGIFIPVTLNNKIQGLRILLDSEYGLDTENIWFSSNNEYNGTKASNWPMVLKDKETNWIDMYNSNNGGSIIIATEMIVAHKLFNNTNKTVIGIPNNIDKDLILSIVKRMRATEVFLYADKYTILHTSTLMYENIIQVLEEQNIKVDFRIALTETNIGSDLNECEEKRKIA
jgi:uncharacterized pyridoxamine 5'-phosphate oxidase family protein